MRPHTSSSHLQSAGDWAVAVRTSLFTCFYNWGLVVDCDSFIPRIHIFFEVHMEQGTSLQWDSSLLVCWLRVDVR